MENKSKFRIFTLIAILSIVGIVLGYRQSYRMKVGTETVLTVKKAIIFEGDLLQRGDIVVAKVLKDRIPGGALTSLEQALNKRLVRQREKGDVLTAADMQSSVTGKQTTLNELIPEGRLLASLSVRKDLVPVASYQSGDRLDVIGIDQQGKAHVVAKDAYYLGSLTPPSQPAAASQKVMGQDVSSGRNKEKEAPGKIVLQLALWPRDVVSLATLHESTARISIVLHGKKEAESGELLQIEAPKVAKPIVKTVVPVAPEPVIVEVLPKNEAEAELKQNLHLIDPRIELQSIRLEGTKMDTPVDSYLLKGRVKDIQRLEKAIILTEQYLGGHGTKVKPLSQQEIIKTRSSSGSGLGGGAGDLGSEADVNPSLGSYLSRGITLSSESGRVISFLKVDDLHQVLVSIRALEIDRKKARRQGINYRVDGEHFSIGQHLFQEALPGNFGGVPTITNGNLGNFAGSYVDSSVAVFAAIEFLEDSGVARSVAEPNVLTLSGELASVLVGGSVPIPSSSLRDTDVFNTFAFQDFGVQLEIRPTVDENNIVTLEVFPSIVKPDVSLSVGEVPGFQVQRVKTVARVKASQSLLIGGLLSNKETVDERKVPFLGDVPYVRNMFRWESRSLEEKELLFIITPVLANDAVEGLRRDVQLPPMDFRDGSLFETPEASSIDSEGLPVSWTEEIDRETLEAMNEVEAQKLQASEEAAESTGAVSPLRAWDEDDVAESTERALPYHTNNEAMVGSTPVNTAASNAPLPNFTWKEGDAVAGDTNASAAETSAPVFTWREGAVSETPENTQSTGE